MPKPSPAPARRSDCPTSSFLDILGDRWTLLVMRDVLLKSQSRYAELAASRERIPTNILADRLAKLEGAGLLTRELYQAHPPRFEYRPTKAGIDLLDVISAMVQWSNKHLPGTKLMPPKRYADAKKEWLKKGKATASAKETR